MKLSSLRLVYIDKLDENYNPNLEYWSEKLLHCLQNHEINEIVSFNQFSPGDKGCVSFSLMCSV